MATAPQHTTTHSIDAPHVAPNGPDAPVARRKRAPGGKRIARPVTAYFVLQILDEDGQPMQFNKRRIKILACERSTDKVLDIIDGGEYENALYIRGTLPPGRAQTVAA